MVRWGGGGGGGLLSSIIGLICVICEVGAARREEDALRAERDPRRAKWLLAPGGEARVCRVDKEAGEEGGGHFNSRRR